MRDRDAVMEEKQRLEERLQRQAESAAARTEELLKQAQQAKDEAAHWRLNSHGESKVPVEPREVKKAPQPTPHSGRSTPPQPDALPVMESAVKAIKEHFVQAKAAGSGWEGGSWVGWEEAGRCGVRRRRGEAGEV